MTGKGYLFAFSASLRLCVRFYDSVIRGLGTACLAEYKSIILFISFGYF